MKTNSNSNFFNPENPLKNNRILFAVGLLLIVCAVVLIFLINPKINFEQFVSSGGGEVVFLFGMAMLFFLGTIFMVATLNVKNPGAKIILGALFLSFVVLTILKESMRYALFVLLVSLIIFVVVKIFGKVFSAFYTLIIFCLPTLFLLSFLWKNVPNLNLTITLYVCFAIMLLAYNICGVKINQLFMRTVLGYNPDEVKQFDYNELKNQINLIYLVAFVSLNLSILFSEQAEWSQLANGINNALITGVCITNINWESLRICKEKK